eukprot:Opistho-2@27266
MDAQETPDWPVDDEAVSRKRSRSAQDDHSSAADEQEVAQVTRKPRMASESLENAKALSEGSEDDFDGSYDGRNGDDDEDDDGDSEDSNIENEEGSGSDGNVLADENGYGSDGTSQGSEHLNGEGSFPVDAHDEIEMLLSEKNADINELRAKYGVADASAHSGIDEHLLVGFGGIAPGVAGDVLDASGLAGADGGADGGHVAPAPAEVVEDAPVATGDEAGLTDPGDGGDGAVRRSTRVRRPVGTTKPDANDANGTITYMEGNGDQVTSECTCDDFDSELCRRCGNCPVCCICPNGALLLHPLVSAEPFPVRPASGAEELPAIRSRSQRRREKSDRIEHGIAGHLEVARRVLQPDFTRDVRKVIDVYRVIIAQAVKNLTTHQNIANQQTSSMYSRTALGSDPLPPSAVRDALLRCMDDAKAAIVKDYKGVQQAKQTRAAEDVRARVDAPSSRESVEPSSRLAADNGGRRAHKERKGEREEHGARRAREGVSSGASVGDENEEVEDGDGSQGNAGATSDDDNDDNGGDDDNNGGDDDSDDGDEDARGTGDSDGGGAEVEEEAEASPAAAVSFPRHLIVRGKYAVTACNPQAIDTKTQFLLGANVNVYLLAAGKGRLYSRHPNLYMFSPNFEEKRVLQSMEIIQNTGSKATLLLRSQIMEIVGHYKPYMKFKKEIAALKTFTLPSKMISRARNAHKVKH